jgi:hypothetical protein
LIGLAALTAASRLASVGVVTTVDFLGVVGVAAAAFLGVVGVAAAADPAGEASRSSADMARAAARFTSFVSFGQIFRWPLLSAARGPCVWVC